MSAERKGIGEKVLDLAEIPEKAAIGVGAGLLAISPLVPAAIHVAGELIVGGGLSLGITRGLRKKA